MPSVNATDIVFHRAEGFSAGQVASIEAAKLACEITLIVEPGGRSAIEPEFTVQWPGKTPHWMRFRLRTTFQDRVSNVPSRLVVIEMSKNVQYNESISGEAGPHWTEINAAWEYAEQFAFDRYNVVATPSRR